MKSIPSPKKFLQILSFGVTALILTIPFMDHTRFSVLFNRLLPIRVILLTLFVVSILYLFRRYLKAGLKKIKQDLFNLTDDPFFVILFFLFLVRAVSIVSSLNLKASLSLLSFFASMIGLYVLMKFCFNNSRFFIFKIIRIYAYVGVLATFFGFIQLLLHLKGVTLQGVLVGGDFIRIPGTFFDANHFPAYLSTIAPLLIGFAWLSDHKFYKGVWWSIYFILVVVTLYTFSRSGVISLLVGTAVFLAYSLRMGFLKKVIPLVLVISAIGVLVLVSDRTPRSLIDRAKSVLDTQEKSTVAHTLLLQGELNLFRSNPILGVGYGSFSEHFRQTEIGKEHLKIDPTSRIRLPAHSIWFEVITETGISGLLLYATLMILVLAGLVNTIQEIPNKTVRVYGASLFSGMVGLLTGGLFYSYNLEFFWIYVFIAIFFSFGVDRLVKEKALFADLSRPERIKWSGLVIPAGLLAISSFLIFWQLGKTHLIDWDEAIYAGIAKNIALSGDFLGMMWKGNFWFEKPPLYMWLTSFMVNLYGVSSFSARFFSALFGVGGVLLTYFLAKNMYGKLTGFLSALILTTSFHYVYYSRNGMLDVPVTFFMIATVLCFWLGRNKPFYYLLAGISLGLGVLTKGPVALLVTPAILIFIILDYQNWKTYFNRFAVLASLLFLLVVLPWHILEYQRFGKPFIDYYFLYHIYTRASSTIDGKGADNWIYIAVIRNSMRIWFIALIPALIWAVWEIIKKNKTALFLVFWALTIFIPFSISKSKLIWYMIPIYPPLAILTGRFLEQIFSISTKYIKKFTSISKGTLETTLALVLTFISLVYVSQNWFRIQPQDFTYDEVKLISEKHRLDASNRVKLVMAGFSPPVPLYYSEGPVTTIPREELQGSLTNKEPLYAVTSYEDAKKQLDILRDASVDASIVSTSGDLALILKP